MPTLRRDKENCWMDRVVVHKKQFAKMFGPGKKGGKEWSAAKQWEEETRDHYLKQSAILTDLKRLLAWGNKYLEYSQRMMSHKTYTGKKRVMERFFKYCGEHNIASLKSITPGKAYDFLSSVYDEAENNGNVANNCRKELLAAWNWGVKTLDDFPTSRVCPFLNVEAFPFERQDRYVPPEEDLIKVLQWAEGQDLVMLLTFYYTGARRGEVFRLVWSDIDLQTGRIRLLDHKTGDKRARVRWLRMHPELAKALEWWRDARPCKVENVFMQIQDDTHLGMPFTERMHFMKNICKKAGVKPFGFHAIRHKAATITFTNEGISAAQILLGHYRASTTDRYVKSAGLYTDHSEIVSALGSSGVGKAAKKLLKTKIPQDLS